MTLPKYEKAITIVELLITVVIITVIIAAISAAMVIGMKIYKNLQSEFEQNQNMVLAVEHLSKYIKDSSYCDETNGGTRLELFDVGGSASLGEYNIANEILSFTPVGATISIEVARGIDLTFAEHTGDSNEAREIKINLKVNVDRNTPFTNTLYLSCRRDYSPTTIWAKAIRFSYDAYSEWWQRALCIIRSYNPSTGDPDGYVVIGNRATIKLNIEGQIEWYTENAGSAIRQTQDGNYIVAGGRTWKSGGKIYKINYSDGSIIDGPWTFAGRSFFCVSEAFDAFGIPDGYIAAGYNGNPYQHTIVKKVDNNGDHIWEQLLGPLHSFSDSEMTLDISYDSSGNPEGYIVTNNSGGGSAGELTKLDLGGAIAPGWPITLDSAAVVQSFDNSGDPNGYVVVGAGQSLNIYKVDQDTAIITWTSDCLPGGWPSLNHSVRQCEDNGYVIVGRTSGTSNFYLVKTDEFGIKEFTSYLGGSGAEECWSVCEAFDGGYVLAGSTSDFKGGSSVLVGYYIVKTGVNGDCSEDTAPDIIVYP